MVVLAAAELLQTTTSKRPTYLLGEFWPDAEERQCAADCQRGLDWGGLAVWRFGASVWTNKTEGTARHEPRLAAVELIPAVNL